MTHNAVIEAARLIHLRVYSISTGEVPTARKGEPARVRHEQPDVDLFHMQKASAGTVHPLSSID